jgi:protein-tyrosine phosphatase
MNKEPSRISFIYQRKFISMYAGSFWFNKDIVEQNPNTSFYSVNLMKEHPLPCTYHLPIMDFSVPDDKAKLNEAIINIIQEMIEKKNTVYMGCFGGVGRTGLVLACIAKSLGIENPISYVRENYSPRSVETDEQSQFVLDFNPSVVQNWLKQYENQNKSGLKV